MTHSTITDAPPEWLRIAGLVGGPLVAGLMLLLGAPEGMKPAAWGVSALAVWMALWWISEAMPLAVTSLLPIVILPAFKLVPFTAAVAPFSSNIIFLFLGGFIIAAGMQKWNLHLRFALVLMRLLGHSPTTILAALMIATCFMAFWISNTATAVMMLPIAVSIATLLLPKNSTDKTFAKALVLGIAYSAAIGGLGTFVGTPTNAILLGFMEKTYGVQFQLSDWMMFGVPSVILIAGFAWAMLSKMFLQKTIIVTDAAQKLEHEYSKLGKMQRGEKIVTAVFLICATLWTFGSFVEDWLGLVLDDASIAIFGALLLFLTPLDWRKAEFALSWKDAERIPWGVLIFFGGSLSLSAALTSTGVTDWLGEELSIFNGLPLWLVVIGVVILLILVSELMSNVATITAFLPILAGLATGMGVDPLLILIPATLAASCGFMMPGASAANALAFGTGYLRVSEMARAGLLLDIMAGIIITLICLFLIPALF